MRHRIAGRKLGRKTASRRALLRSLTTDLLHYEKVETTEPKAREIRKLAERMITLGKRGRVASQQAESASGDQKRDHLSDSLHVRRQAYSFVMNKETVEKTFDELAERYEDRPGGYTRLIKIGPRHGDGAPMAIIQLV